MLSTLASRRFHRWISQCKREVTTCASSDSGHPLTLGKCQISSLLATTNQVFPVGHCLSCFVGPTSQRACSCFSICQTCASLFCLATRARRSGFQITAAAVVAVRLSTKWGRCDMSCSLRIAPRAEFQVARRLQEQAWVKYLVSLLLMVGPLQATWLAAPLCVLFQQGRLLSVVLLDEPGSSLKHLWGVAKCFCARNVYARLQSCRGFGIPSASDV